jgi:serine/threonine protein kinase
MAEYMCPHCHAVYVEKLLACSNDGSILIEVPVLNDLSGKVLRQKYRLDETLGQGGFGAVYKATHLVLGKQVAVKVLRAEFRNDSTMVARFFNEARVVTRLTNPHTINTFDLDQAEEGFLFMVMDFVKGRTLRSLARHEGDPPGRLPWERSINLLIQVCEALEEAHAAGVVHRDLKPDNVMVSNRGGAADFVTVLDFGIAKVIEGSDMQNLTAAGMLLGSPAYMSPEQVKGGELSALSDIYSLGVIAYQVLSGLLPVTARQTAAILQEKILTRPEPLSRKVPDLVLPLELENLVMNMLEVDESLRPQTATEIKEKFIAILRSEGGELAVGLGVSPSSGVSSAPRAEGTVGYEAPFKQPPEPQTKVDEPKIAPVPAKGMTQQAPQSAPAARPPQLTADEEPTRVPGIVTSSRPRNRRLLVGLAVSAIVLVAIAVGLAVGIGMKTKEGPKQQETAAPAVAAQNDVIAAQPAGVGEADLTSKERLVEEAKQPTTTEKVAIEKKAQPVEEKKEVAKEEKQPVEEKKEVVKEEKQPVEEKQEVVKEKKQPVEEKREVVKEEKKPVEEKKEVVKEEKKPVEEKKEVVKEEKKPVEEKKEVVKEEKKPVEEKKEVVKEDKKPVEEKKEVVKEEKKPVEEKKEVVKEEKKPVEEKREVVKEEKKEPVDEVALKKEIEEKLDKEMNALDEEISPGSGGDHIDNAFDELDGEDPW